ncbi:MAG: PIN domain-containing protein [Anaerolineae bacterium]
MSMYVVLRLFVMLIAAFLGWELGVVAATWLSSSHPVIAKGYYQLILTSTGAVLGFVGAPYLTVVPFRAMRAWLRQAPVRDLLMGAVGLVAGLIIAALLALPLSMLPGALGHILPLVCALLLGGVGTVTMVMRDREILSFLGLFVASDAVKRKRDVVLLDTSVIIDGRVADICQTGFITGTMIVPRFVLEELQHISDSADLLRRNRGRRGLEILNQMQKSERVPLEVSELDEPQTREVDAKLVKLAKELDCPIMTNDYNLNRVAELQGVQVLNINELANAVKSVVLPGESLHLQIIQEGKEIGQGVGYLDDGTMVVVEDGRRHLNAAIDIVVTRVLQTVAGRMIFGQPGEAKR